MLSKTFPKTGITDQKIVPQLNILIHKTASDAMLDSAYQWLIANQTDVALPAWETLKPQLQVQLLSGEYCFQPVISVETTHRLGEPETQEIWQAQDQLVLKAISLALKDHLKQEFSSCCHHLEGRSGIKKAVRKTRDYVQANPQSWVMKTDVTGYYAHIDHFILHQQFCALLPQETYLQRLIWQYLKRSVYNGGNYEDVERGISLGCPLSPLMAALYLKPLDDLFAETTPSPSFNKEGSQDVRSPSLPRRGLGGGLFYARFMDDFVVIALTRWNLQNQVAEIQMILENLKLEDVAEKTVICRTDRVFEFLGYHFSPTALTVAQKTLQRRDMRLARLYEQPSIVSTRAVIPALAGIQIDHPSSPLLTKEGLGEVDSHLRGNDESFENNRTRIKSARYSFEAKLLALGSASLLATTATDSHATIHLVQLNQFVSSLGYIDLNGDSVTDFRGYGSLNLEFNTLINGDWRSCPMTNSRSCILSGVDNTPDFVRLRFDSNGATSPLYAWILVNLASSPPGASIVCYAYQDDGTDIDVGMTDEGVVDPNTCEVPPPPPPKEPPKPSPPSLPPLPSTMSLKVDFRGTGTGSLNVQMGKDFPGTGGTLGTCKNGDECYFPDLETASWVKITPTADPGSEFKGWGGSTYCNDGNPFIISNISCVAYFNVLAPQSPLELVATAISANQIDLTWRDNSTRETGYVIERSNDQTTWTILERTVADTINYSDLSLTCDTTYYYRVTAYNSSGQSAPSNIANAMTVVCPVPPPVAPPPIVDPVSPPVVAAPVIPPTPPATEPAPPVPPATDPIPPVTEPTPPVETPVTQPPEMPTITEEFVEMIPPAETTPPVELPPISTEPTPEPAPNEPLPVETVENTTNLQVAEKPPVDTSPYLTDKLQGIHLDEAWDAEGQVIKNLKIVRGGSLADAIITGRVTSDEGMVSDLTLESTAVLEGGYVTNRITNNGLIKDITFVGTEITGGTLAGNIVIASQVPNTIQNVTLAAGAVIQGKMGEEFVTAKLAGKITGDAKNPALLENVTITAGTQLDNVILGKDVILEEGVILGENVTFADGSQKPEEPTVCEPNALGLDKNSKEINGLKACFTVKPGQQAVEISIQVDPAHVDQEADLLFVIKASATEWYSLDNTKWQAWNGNLDNLKAKETLKLPETIVLEFANREFSELGNQLTLFVGYQLQDGTIVYNSGESL